jgi:hypothetical protein
VNAIPPASRRPHSPALDLRLPPLDGLSCLGGVGSQTVEAAACVGLHGDFLALGWDGCDQVGVEHGKSRAARLDDDGIFCGRYHLALEGLGIDAESEGGLLGATVKDVVLEAADIARYMTGDQTGELLANDLMVHEESPEMQKRDSPAARDGGSLGGGRKDGDRPREKFSQCAMHRGLDGLDRLGCCRLRRRTWRQDGGASTAWLASNSIACIPLSFGQKMAEPERGCADFDEEAAVRRVVKLFGLRRCRCAMTQM